MDGNRTVSSPPPPLQVHPTTTTTQKKNCFLPYLVEANKFPCHDGGETAAALLIDKFTGEKKILILKGSHNQIRRENLLVVVDGLLEIVSPFTVKQKKKLTQPQNNNNKKKHNSIMFSQKATHIHGPLFFAKGLSQTPISASYTARHKHPKKKEIIFKVERERKELICIN